MNAGNAKNVKESNFWSLARSFLHEYMPKVRRLSPKTIESYKDSLNSYINFLGSECGVKRSDVSFEEFSRERLKAYVSWMRGTRNYAPKTSNLRMTAIKSFLKYCADEDIALVCFHKGAKSICGLKEAKKPIVFMGKSATAALLDATPTDTVKGRRNRMLLILMYDSGARVGEIADIILDDIHLTGPHPFITLTGKGNKTRNVPLMRKTVTHLVAYIKEFHNADGKIPLFYSNLGGEPHALSSDSISLILKKAARLARQKCDSVPDRIHCHLIRKTRAMDLYQEGVSLPIVMQILGHENIGTTAGFYAFATMEMMYSEMEKAFPNASKDTSEWKGKAFMDVLYSLD